VSLAQPTSIGVYGLGRFGVFYASLLSRLGTVRAWSRDPDKQPPPGVIRVPSEQELCRLPVVVLCVAISAMQEVLRRIAPLLAPGTLVMDTCSVKALPARWMRELLPDSVQVLATHPMFGPDSGRASVAGLPLVLCPVRCPPEVADRWHEGFAGLGLAVRRMDPDEHDREAAFTQGLTHYVGRVLSELRLKNSPIATVGYRKLLEIVEQTCNDSWQLFFDLQRHNPHTREMRRELERSLRRVRRVLDGQDSPEAASRPEEPRAGAY
jgi:prephenate dehydrogenase